ncbi:TIGR00725 family protein [Nitrospira sp. KM1]|uniref:LOG family protein n=1 Tax=Nitrospira sp. KM1 TaxID=1936990 RepID=UPI0013A76992|nr:LOG family protein [Nitrospira sp. KM1]BCA55210.1 TIGR00725 family protein [Nitrospira sp. KM1]
MRYVVGVMGPAKARRKDIENARALGELIARREWVLLTGGRDVGVMHAANQGAKRVPRSLTVGVLPSTRDRVSKYVDVAIVTEMGNARNNICVLSSHVIVACGLGGAGTVSEVALALKAGKYVILLGATPAEDRFFKNLGGKSVFSVQTPEDAINVILKMLEQDERPAMQGPQTWARF